MKHFRGLSLIIITAIVLSLVGSSANAIELSELEKSVIMIRATNQDFNFQMPWKQGNRASGVGTGFVIAGNRILTNAHNVANGREIELRKQNTAQRFTAKVVFVSHSCDLAILEPEDPMFFFGTEPLEIGGIPKVNSTVQTCGYPMGGQLLSVTEGVVSRVQMSVYSHPRADSHLVVQTDAAINPGNSGGPVIQDGKVVGVAFQGLTSGDNIGYMIPTPVINHFLKDIEDGTVNDFGNSGFVTANVLHCDAFKKYIKLPADQDGAVVVDTQANSTVDGVLLANDVITAIDEYNVDNDGMINIYGMRLLMDEAIEQKQIGEEVTYTFYRDGQEKQMTVEVLPNMPLLSLTKQYDIEPKYCLYSGLVFTNLSRNYLEAIGGAPTFQLRYLLNHSMETKFDPKREEFVVLSAVLSDEVNTYTDGFTNELVEKINGVQIWSLADVLKAFEKDVDGFFVVEFKGQNKPLVLDAQKARDSHRAIMEKYNVPAETNVKVQD
ncbi:MAG: trypsin-like peptidase domain-containing protein [Phycisphaerae bacterium]|nr:trypsin-like peptidase domain-containing protein [Phycisphaerae bacterium]